jgi:hypothetical protein
MTGAVEPSRSGITPRWQPDAEERAAALREVRARGWALTDQELAPGIRSVAAPLRDGDGQTIAALNVTVHAAETPVEVLTGEYLPWLLQTAGAISADWAACQHVSQVTITRATALSGRAADVGLVGVGPARAGLDAAVSPVPALVEEPVRHLFRWHYFRWHGSSASTVIHDPGRARCRICRTGVRQADSEPFASGQAELTEPAPPRC